MIALIVIGGVLLLLIVIEFNFNSNYLAAYPRDHPVAACKSEWQAVRNSADEYR